MGRLYVGVALAGLIGGWVAWEPVPVATLLHLLILVVAILGMGRRLEHHLLRLEGKIDEDVRTIRAACPLVPRRHVDQEIVG